MLTVKFNDVGEFLAELRLDKEDVERGIVRVTNRWRRLDPYPMQGIAVVASYGTCEQLVIVEADCGSFLPGMGDETQARSRVSAHRDVIERTACELGLQVRAGVFG